MQEAGEAADFGRGRGLGFCVGVQPKGEQLSGDAVDGSEARRLRKKMNADALGREADGLREEMGAVAAWLGTMVGGDDLIFIKYEQGN
jgi:hypothetical protein